MSVETDLRRGSTLAGYRVEALVGRGGMGVVYLASDPRLERRVALKLIAPELADDPRFRERFLRESRLVASLDHSHVVPVYEAGEVDGQLYLAMRYVDGEDLASLLGREGPLEPGRALDLVGQVGEALDAAHERGLVHRDVKPANVLVAKEGGREHCYLTDFGLARDADVDPGAPTHLSGSVDYTAPEQIAHEQTDGRADVYSLGCVLYECLAGEPPFKRPRPMATLFAHTSEEAPSLHELRPELPEAIDDVLAKALAKSPDDRYGTGDELCGAARAALGLDQRPGLTRRRLLVAAGLGVLAAAGASVAAVALARDDGAPAAAAPAVPLPLAESSLVRIDPATNELVAAVPTGTVAVGPAIGDGSVWVVGTGSRELLEIDPAANGIVGRTRLGPVGLPLLLAVGGGAAWLLAPGDDRLWRLDPSAGAVERIELNAVLSGGLAFADGTVWVSSSVPSDPTTVSLDEYPLLRLDPASGRVLAAIDYAAATFIAVGAGELWTAGQYGGLAADPVTWLWRVDPGTNRAEYLIEDDRGYPATMRLEYPISGLAVGDSGVWVTSIDDDSVVRIDPETKASTEFVRVGRGVAAIAVGEDAVWVANSRDDTVSRVDPDTLDVTMIPVGGTPLALAVGEGGVWVTVRAD